jgi:hypothetical protein
MSNEVMRARQWLQNDQRRLWDNEMKMRTKKLERARAELFSVSMSKLQEVSSVQQLLVHRAEQACEEAQKKLAMLKKWDHELENRSEPLVKQVDQFQSFITAEMPKAIAYLGQAIRALEAYTEVRMGGATEAPAPEHGRQQSAAGRIDERAFLEVGGHEELLARRQGAGIRAQIFAGTFYRRRQNGRRRGETG